MTLSQKETAQMVTLLKKMGNEVPSEVREALKGTEAGEAITIVILQDLTWPVPHKVFGPWCGASITNPFELAPLNNKCDKVLMFFRDDETVRQQWHLPGTVIIPGDTIASAQERLLANEVKTEVTPPEFVSVVEFSADKHHRGQEISLLHRCNIDENRYNGEGRFFRLDSLPSDTYPTHRKLISTLCGHM